MNKIVAYIYVKPFNAELLDEQIAGAFSGIPISAIWRGFYDVSERRKGPFAEPQPVGERTVNGVTTYTWADPGDIRFSVPDSFTTGDEATLDALLAAHDYTQTTAEQDRRDQDEADIATLWAAYHNWDTLTDAQFKGAMKIFLRVMYRREKGGAI